MFVPRNLNIYDEIRTLEELFDTGPKIAEARDLLSGKTRTDNVTSLTGSDIDRLLVNFAKAVKVSCPTLFDAMMGESFDLVDDIKSESDEDGTDFVKDELDPEAIKQEIADFANLKEEDRFVPRVKVSTKATLKSQKKKGVKIKKETLDDADFFWGRKPGEEMFECVHCPEKNRKSRPWNKHRMHMHNCHKSLMPKRVKKIRVKTSHECGDCGKVLNEPWKLKFHITTVHEKKKRLICELCGKGFVLPQQLRKHVATVHDKIRPYKCDECDKEFAMPFNLARHKRDVHEQIKPYQCKICGMRFSQKANLLTWHRKKHHGEEVF